MSDNSDLMPIRVMAELTGVNSITLRAWERRYGLIKPLRTSSGHRLYSQADRKLIEKILAYLARGIAVSQVKKLIVSPEQPLPLSVDIWSAYKQHMLKHVVEFDSKALDSIYNDALALYPIEILAEKLLLPLFNDLNEQLQAGGLACLQFFKIYVRNKLGSRFHHANIISTGPKVICACLSDENNELQLLLFALYLLAHGYQIIHLGSNLSVTELSHASAIIKPIAIILAAGKKNAIIEGLHVLHQATYKPIFILGSEQTLTPTAARGVILLQDNCYHALKQFKEQIKIHNFKRKHHV
jgi:DNA-binding transcriptional MerR regulator